MASLDFVKVIDPRTDVNNALQRTYGIFSSGQNQIWQGFEAQSLGSSNVNYVCTPPSERMFVNRRIYIRHRYLMTFTGTAPVGSTLLQAVGLRSSAGVSPGVASFDAPRCFPLSQAITTVTCTLGSYPVATNLNDYSRIFPRIARDLEEEDGELSTSPSMPDQSIEYSDLDGFARSPLNAYGDSVVQVPRGGYSDCLITRNDVSANALVPITATVELTCCEPLWMSPFNFGDAHEVLSLIGLSNFNINLATTGRGNGLLAGLGGSMWSHSTGGNTLTSIVATPLQGTAFFNFMTPDMTMNIPPVIPYSYSDISLKPSEQKSSVAAGATQVITSQNYNLQSTPKRLILWADERTADFDCTKTDVSGFFIDNISINFNGRSSILADASPYDLYQMSRKNGLNMSWEQFKYRFGSLIIVDVGMDLALDPMDAAGLLQNINLYVTARCTNLRNRAVVPTLNILVVSEGVMWIKNGVVNTEVGLLDKNMILSVKDTEGIPYKPSKMLTGSGFWSDAWSGLKKMIRPAINIAKAIVPGQFQPIVGAVDEVARSAGYGYGKTVGGKFMM